MADDPSVPVEPPDRIITLTDGVVAIAMTLLVLDLSAIDYQGGSASGLWQTLSQESGRFVAFFIAFWVIAQFWLAHHKMFRSITAHEDGLALRNFVFLFGISLLPFTTKLLGQVEGNSLAVTLFSLNLFLISVALTGLSMWAYRMGMGEKAIDRRAVLLLRARRVSLAVLVVVPGALAWVISPSDAQLLFLLLFFSDVPGRILLRMRDRRAAA